MDSLWWYVTWYREARIQARFFLNGIDNNYCCYVG